MTPPTDFDFMGFVKDFIWAPALGLVAWAWNRNEKEHDRLWEQTERLKTHTSDGYSTLNDRVMEHIDGTVAEIKDENRRRIDKMDEHITKLFENAEQDRKEFSKMMAEHREDSYKRHIELLHAINSKADRKDTP